MVWADDKLGLFFFFRHDFFLTHPNAHQQIPGAVYYISKYKGEADKKFKHTKHNKFG